MGQHYCQLTSKQKHDILGRGNYASPFFMSDQFEFKPKNLSEKELEKEISDILKMSSNCKECDPSNTEITDQLENSIDENFMPNIGVSSDEINRLYQEQLKKTNTTLPKEIEKQLEKIEESYVEELEEQHVERLHQQIVRDNANGFWKYEEDETLKELQDYLSGTYRSHYTSRESKTQTLDLIESIGDAEPFCRSNAIKYLSRFGKKNGKSKLDILKAMHYCVLLYHFAGLHKKTTDNYETF